MKRLLLTLLLSVIVCMSSFSTDINKKIIKLDNNKVENVTINIPSIVSFHKTNNIYDMSIIAKDSIILHMINYKITDKTLIIDLNNHGIDDNCNDLKPIDIRIILPDNIQLATSKNMQILNRSNIKKNKIKSAKYEN